MRSLRMLYVEDEEAAVFLVRTALKEMTVPIDLSHVADGEQAFTYLGINGPDSGPRPDIILLDLNLPRITGLEVLAEIYKDSSLRRIPVIVFTSSVLPVNRRESLALGAQEYIVKPSSYDAIVDVIRSVCAYLPASQTGSAH